MKALTCSIAECPEPVHARGKCLTHYYREYRARLKADAAASRDRMLTADAEAKVTTAELQERVTYEAHPCPECGQAMVGARVWDPVAQEAFVGAVCVPCDGAYRIVWSAA